MNGEEVVRQWREQKPTTDAKLAKLIDTAIAAERAKWVAACWAAYNAGYSDQGWTAIFQMGATKEV